MPRLKQRQQLTIKQVLALASFKKTGPAADAARRFNVTPNHIRRIRRGLRRSSVSGITPDAPPPPHIEFLSPEDQAALENFFAKTAAQKPLKS